MGRNLLPVNLGQDQKAKAIVAGRYYTCALLRPGRVRCWGIGDNGVLGRGDTRTIGTDPSQLGDSLQDVPLGTNRTAIAIAAGFNSACAIRNDRSLVCWGFGCCGQLGQGNRETLGDEPGELGDALPAIDLGRHRKVMQVAMKGLHVGVLLDDGTVKVFGSNVLGECGQGNTNEYGSTPNSMHDLPPVDLGTGRTATAIAVGGSHTCALLDNGSVKCFGYGTAGQLGYGVRTTIGNKPGQMGDALPAVALGTV